MCDHLEEDQRKESADLSEIRLYTDGACRGNPGDGGIAFIMLSEDGKEIERGCTRIGKTTNNRAEYIALLEGLSSAQKIGAAIVHCYLDSELTVRQLTGEYRIKDEELRWLYDKVLMKEACFEKVTYTHVPRSHPIISQADLLVNSAFKDKRNKNNFTKGERN